MKTMKLTDMILDAGTQCRVSMVLEKIHEYKEKMDEGDVFPPLLIVSDGVSNWLADGFHRWHAYKLRNVKEIEVIVKHGTLEDAKLEALKANGKHGIPLTNADKRLKVQRALELPGGAEKSNYEIAKLCDVSQPFVAAYRNPEAKERQDQSRAKSAAKKVKTDNPISNESPIDTGPDESEIRASELAREADIAAMYKVMDADEPLKEAHEEIKRLNLVNSQLEVRIQGLMNEKNEAIKMVKSLQKEVEKLRNKK